MTKRTKTQYRIDKENRLDHVLYPSSWRWTNKKKAIRGARLLAKQLGANWIVRLINLDTHKIIWDNEGKEQGKTTLEEKKHPEEATEMVRKLAENKRRRTQTRGKSSQKVDKINLERRNMKEKQSADSLMNWFKRHLNWTFFVAYGVCILIVFICGAALRWTGTSISAEPLGIAGCIIANIVMLLTSIWILRRKNRSLWWILLSGFLSPVWLSNKREKKGELASR